MPDPQQGRKGEGKSVSTAADDTPADHFRTPWVPSEFALRVTKVGLRLVRVASGSVRVSPRRQCGSVQAGAECQRQHLSGRRHGVFLHRKLPVQSANQHTAEADESEQE